MPRERTSLMKNRRDGMVAGVCAGLGDYFDVDTTLVRAVFVAAAVMSGFGIVLYVVLWVLLDDAPLSSEEPPTIEPGAEPPIEVEESVEPAASEPAVIEPADDVASATNHAPSVEPDERRP